MSDKEKDSTKPTPPTPEEQISKTIHTVTIEGEQIGYVATTGTMLLREEDDDEGHKVKASIFYVAYTKVDADVTNRPITFAFNGGPGSASVWLHLGLLGPRRVLMDEIGNPLRPPYQLVNNEFSLLDVSDVVFIDPVSTGYSRAIPGEKPDQYHGFKKDIESIAEFIRLYTSRNGRWASPKFLAGESYGTTR
ncbi:MAG TPA: peptidase S10, partial [Anaerolineae bacterium]|nr:peptidase S10 [Anaerolineae bacterium]